jgi:exodeoxyribonuclease V alpha subunit
MENYGLPSQIRMKSILRRLPRSYESANLVDMESLRGVVERITFHNEENGYTVAKLTPERGPRYFLGNDREVAIVGNMAGIHVGESVELGGRWVVHAEYGKQFMVEQMRSVLPATIAGIEKYLGSGLIKGVGPVTAKRIVEYFGLETLEVIEQAPERLMEVPKIGRKRVILIQQAWQEQRAIKEVMIFLQSHGVSTSLATKIYKFYGDEAIPTVKNDPYRLARDIFGIGFLTADRIAQSLGLALDAPQRVAAGVAYALNQASDEGHVFLPTTELIKQAAELLAVSHDQTALGIIRLQADDQVKIAATPGSTELMLTPANTTLPAPSPDAIPQLIAEHGQLYTAGTLAQAHTLLEAEHAVYLTSLFYSEIGVANRLLRLLREGVSLLRTFQAPQFPWTNAFAAVEKATHLQLAPQQQAAAQAALTHRLTVLTGGPGTGKTTTVRTILHLCERAQRRVLLAAPTGRAAKRLSETTGREAKTIHRLLEFKPTDGMAFQRNESNPLEGDLLIVDEASMLDLVLTNHLLKAVPPGMHLLLVGDVDQLPSVGAGNVLKDIIHAIENRVEHSGPSSVGSGQPPAAKHQPPIPHPPSPISLYAKVVRLHTIFRQEAGSFIITNAHRINRGELPTIDHKSATDFFLFKVEEAEAAAQLCVELVQTRIPRRFAIPSQDIQVLSPMHRGAAGVAALNEALQSALNPASIDKPQRQIGSRFYRVGDRVMQIRNNYEKDVYNGDMGVIQRMDVELQKLAVQMDGRAVVYDFLELDELVHAYAVSVHKSQGSEFPAVVIPILTSHYMLLQRNLLYTAVTRARRLVVLVGQMKAIGMAVRNNQVTERYTGLQNRLQTHI